MTRALVVDDKPDNLFLLRALLEEEGFEVEAARNGAEALAKARVVPFVPFDVIVSDLLMPVMDGYTLLREWKADASLRRVPFIVCSSAFIDQNDEQQARDLGADAFVIKPAEPELFKATVDEVLERAQRGEVRTGRDEERNAEVPRSSSEMLVAKLEEKAAALERANRELSISEGHYRLLFDVNPQPMWVYDLETLCFLAVNDAAVAHYGYSRDEFLAMTIADLRFPEDLARLLDNIARVGDDTLDQAGIWRHRKRDGSLIDVEITSHALHFSGRRAELVLAQDVTQRRRAQSAVQESERFTRSTLDSLDAQVAIIDEAGTILAVNRAWRQFAVDNGGALAELCEGANYLASCEKAAGLDAGVAHAFAAGIRGALTGERRSFSVEYACHAPAEQRWINARVVRFVGDGPVRAVITHFDVTERMRAQCALQASEQRFRATFEQAAVGMAHVALDGRFLDVNQKLCAIVGYTRDELLACTFQDITHPDDLARNGLQLRRALAGEVNSYTARTRYLRKSGEAVLAHLTAVLVRQAGGRPDYFVSVIEDICERNRAVRNGEGE